MTPAQPAAAAQALPPTFRPVPTIGAAVAKPATPWVLPAVGLLTSAMFAVGAIKLFSIRNTTALMWEYAGWTVLVLAVIATLPPKPRSRLQSPIGITMLLFVGAVALSTLLIYAGDLRSDIGKLLPQEAALLLMTLPFFVFEAAAKRANPERCILLTCHVILLLAAWSVLGDFVGLAHYESTSSRYFGFLGDGVAWALTLPLLVYFCSRRLVLAGACLVLLGLTGSRAPALCVAAAIVLLIAFGRGRRLQYVLVLCVMGAVAVYYADVFTTLADRLSATQLAGNDRFSTAALGLKVFERSPLFGSGYNAQAFYFPETIRRLQLGQLQVQTSTFIQMIAEGGIILFAAYMAFVIAVTVGGVALIRSSQLFATSGVLNGVAVWLLSMLWVNQSAAWFLVGAYIGPLIFGMAGIVSGYYAHLRLVRRHQRSGQGH